jgi:hypothetical protein
MKNYLKDLLENEKNQVINKHKISSEFYLKISKNNSIINKNNHLKTVHKDK